MYILAILNIMLVSGIIGIIIIWKVVKDKHNTNIFEGIQDDIKYWNKGNK